MNRLQEIPGSVTESYGGDAARITGRAVAPPAVSGASPETYQEIHYSKRRLPHFERPSEKYAIAFTTYERCELTVGMVWQPEPFDLYIRSESDLHEKFQYICRNPWQAANVGPNDDYAWLWTPDREICPARAPNRAGEAPAL